MSVIFQELTKLNDARKLRIMQGTRLEQLEKQIQILKIKQDYNQFLSKSNTTTDPKSRYH